MRSKFASTITCARAYNHLFPLLPPPTNMTPLDFIRKWKRSTLTERSGSHEHFLDLCALTNQPTPAGADPDGTAYTFERGVSKSGGGKGWADVWKRHHFAWE